VHDVFPYEREKRFIALHSPGEAGDEVLTQLPPEPVLTGLSGLTP